MIAEGRSSSILTDICMSGDNCHIFWPFSHSVLNIFFNEWRISQKTQGLYFPNIDCCSSPRQKCMVLMGLTLASSAIPDPLIFYSLP